MAPTVNKAPKIKIVNPKNNAGNDLSDHYPIKMNINNLTVVSYNLQLMHLQVSSATAKGKETQSEIAQAVHDFVNFFVKQQADVCCVQELFDGEANKLMEDKMDKAGYFALARVGSTPYEVFNGGVRTFVKKSYLASPSRGLLSSYEHIYSEKIDYFVGADALANKGVSHTVITTEQKSVHIFIYKIPLSNK